MSNDKRLFRVIVKLEMELADGKVEVLEETTLLETKSIKYAHECYEDQTGVEWPSSEYTDKY